MAKKKKSWEYICAFDEANKAADELQLLSSLIASSESGIDRSQMDGLAEILDDIYSSIEALLDFLR